MPADVKLEGVVRHIRAVAGARLSPEGTDRQLLLAFSVRGEQAAFAALVERHGPMVLRVCRRVLRHAQDAEDAFQATFLVLAQKATSIRKTEALASWLHGVAHRVALRARRDAGRRRAHEREVKAMPAKNDPRREPDWIEVQAALDEEVQALPEIYRGPFVLCFLEGRSRAEAAQELGLKEGTVWSRLVTARKRLHKKLAGRGIGLPALLAAAALSEGAARAVPVGLTESTLQAVAAGLVSTRVAALAKEVSKTMSLVQMKTVFLCLATAVLVACGAGAAVMQHASARPPAARDTKPSSPPRAAREAPANNAIEDAGATVTFRGRVLGPDGKPLKGVKLTLWSHFGYHGHYREWHPSTPGPFQPTPLVTSGKDGRFSATFRKSDVKETPLSMWQRPWRHVQVVAAAPGYGPAWASLGGLDRGELTLRLVKDDAPLKGRVLSLEGRPVTGAAVRVVRLTARNEVHNSLWQTSWEGMPGDLKTDHAGCFTLSGLGSGREVLLSIEGPGIEHRLVAVRTPGAVKVLAGPTKVVEGTVRVKGTQKPLAGVVVYGNEEAHQRRVRAVTDAQGRYRLVGLAKAKSYELTFYPPFDSGCLGTLTRVADTVGPGPVRADVEVRRGIEVRCRLIDSQTRQLVPGELHYTPLEPNPLYREAEESPGLVPNRTFRRIHVPGPDGVIRLVAYPGLGLLFGMLQGQSFRYLPGRVAPADLARAQGGVYMEFAKLTGVYRLIDPKEGDKPLAIDIELNPGRKASGSLSGPDGKPVSGAMAHGLDYHPLRGAQAPGQRLDTAAFTATLLDPHWPRTVSFVHRENKLVGHAVLKGDEKGLVAVQLRRWGVLTGRLVGGDGKPVAGVRLGWRYPSLPTPGFAPSGQSFTTDGEGRFRVEGLLPGVKFEIALSDGAKKAPAFSAGAALKGLSVEAGQTRDVGDVRVAATPQAKKPQEG
jgi:RNA polymerase sigma factor (sigma-70 family)